MCRSLRQDSTKGQNKVPDKRKTVFLLIGRKRGRFLLHSCPEVQAAGALAGTDLGIDYAGSSKEGVGRRGLRRAILVLRL